MSFQGNKDVRVQGSSISLAPTGVNPGIYNQVQVDANGRVLAGGGGSGTPVSGSVTVALSGDASGSASGSGANPTITVPMTLDTVNSNVGTFQGLTVNAKGLVIAAANQAYLTGNQTITLSGDVTGSGTTAIAVTLDTVNSNVGTFQGLTVNGKGLVTAAVQTTQFYNGSVPNYATTNTTGVMVGLGSTWKVTPAVTGRLRVTVNGYASNGTSGDGYLVAPRYGTGAAPIQGAAATGSSPTDCVQQATSCANNATVPYSMTAIITGLAIGTAVWFDLQFQALTGGTATLAVACISVDEF